MTVSVTHPPSTDEPAGNGLKSLPHFRPASVVKYMVLILVALIMVFPIYWIAVSSLKTNTQISSLPPTFFPIDPHWGNYVRVLLEANTLYYLRNSALLVAGTTVGTLLSSAIVAYPLARMQFRGRSTIFAAILATMMVPSVTVLIPQYLLFRQFGWLDSYLPMIVPAFFAAPYNVFLFRQFFMGIPRSLDEAAKLDGANTFQIFTRITMPLSVPVTVTVALLSGITWWNELLLPLIYINEDQLKPVSLGAITSFLQPGTGVRDWPATMAFAVLMSIPPMIAYMVAGRFLRGGIKTAGIK